MSGDPSHSSPLSSQFFQFLFFLFLQVYGNRLDSFSISLFSPNRTLWVFVLLLSGIQYSFFDLKI